MLNGSGSEALARGRSAHLHDPYPQGESWRQAVERVGRFLEDVPLRSRKRVLVIGHVATRWALDYIKGVALEQFDVKLSAGSRGDSYDCDDLRVLPRSA